MPPRWTDPRVQIGVVLALITLAAAIFGLWPETDRWFSALFYDGQDFPAEADAVGQRLRLFVWDLSIAMFAVALVMTVYRLVRRAGRGIPLRVWGFILAVYLAGPILLVNRLLKEHWGRARPDTTTDFGGDWTFTPFWEPGRQCLANCSFTSGEAASAVALTVALLTLGPWVLRSRPRALQRAYGAIAVILPLAAPVQRVVAGRHFLSDVLFSMLFVLLIAAVLRPLILTRRPAPDPDGGPC